MSLKALISQEEAELIRSLSLLAQRIESGEASAAEIEIANKVLCEVNNQIAACPLTGDSPQIFVLQAKGEEQKA